MRAEARGSKSAPIAAEFAKRLEQACDAHPHCPPMHAGRHVWIKEQLAKSDVSVSMETIRRWYAGEVRPRQDKCVVLAQVLNVDSMWLFIGTAPEMTIGDRKVRNALANGIVNVVAGFIQMDGGTPAFPDDDDKRAKRDNINLYAVVKGASYSLHVLAAEERSGEMVFQVPLVDLDEIVVLGVVRDGFSVQVVPITQDITEKHGSDSGRLGRIIPVKDVAEYAIDSFSQRF